LYSIYIRMPLFREGAGARTSGSLAAVVSAVEIAPERLAVTVA
jgi:hypothetical protein